MAFYNASVLPGEFYSQRVDNLCGTTTYEFSAWVANVINPAILTGVNPDITFKIELTDGTTMASYLTARSWRTPASPGYSMDFWSRYRPTPHPS